VSRQVLLDTGFLVALVNRDDPDHRRCVEAWAPLRAEVVSVDGVLVEAAWLLRKARGGARRAVEIVLTAKVRVEAGTPALYTRALDLMARYHDVPMDLVDALLVATAEHHDIAEVLTLDRRGFGTYRRRGRHPLALLPAN
jgi:hypothetical protein